ncbi:MAG: DNA replication and repair protein RecF [Bacteroidales bacterium]|nr:DNA replication and repair protein RecF [Bacteroidales bacterium]
MAILNKIVVQNFRNIELQELEFCANVNCLSGGNGEGKTNLLDAIWYLSMTKSATGSADSFNLRYGAPFFAIAGTYTLPSGQETRVSVQVQGGEKQMRRDDKPYTRLASHIGLLPVVMVSPSDISLVSDSGEERRRFVNSVLSQMDVQYLGNVQQYVRLLQQRNRLLKEGNIDFGYMEALDGKMDAVAQPIFERRRDFVAGIAPVVQEYYSRISGGREMVSISYRSDLQKGDLKDVLKAHRDRDLLMHYTTAGMQRDDFIFEMGGHPIRKCGSQGQQKSFLVALKFAQYELMKQASGYPPMLLLDDLFDKLDLGRVQNLLSMVSGNEFGQIFLSDSNKVRLRGIVDGLTSERTYYEAKGGVFTRNG